MSRTVTLLTRADCHLCDVARRVAGAVCADTGAELVETDVDGDAGLRAEYGDRVPVLLVDGREHSYWTVDQARLRRALVG